MRDPLGTATQLGQAYVEPYLEGAEQLKSGQRYEGTATISEASSDLIVNAVTGAVGTVGKVLGAIPGGKVNLPSFSKADFPDVATTISRQRQERHLTNGPGKDPDRGGELARLEDAQAVLDAYHSGAARIVGKTVQGDPIVEFGGVTGINKSPGAGYPNQPTNVFIIKGTKSVSVVPTSPAKSGK